MNGERNELCSWANGISVLKKYSISARRNCAKSASSSQNPLDNTAQYTFELHGNDSLLPEMLKI